jgi:hypothetical protein
VFVVVIVLALAFPNLGCCQILSHAIARPVPTTLSLTLTSNLIDALKQNTLN